MYDFQLGSKTARGGFANERAVCRKFNNWEKDKEARLWLQIMGYELKKIKNLKAIQIPTRIKKTALTELGLKEEEYDEIISFKKADVQVQIRLLIKLGDLLKIENLSLKKANADANYNQVDKRWVDPYKKMWGFSNQVALGLKLFTGELSPAEYPNKLKVGISQLKDKRRVYLNELKDNLLKQIMEFFNKNKILVVSDLLKGRGGLAADWILVTRYNKETNITTWILKDINKAMNFFGQGEVKLSPKGSLCIGRIIMQRKGGTPDPTKLQFKIRPCELFQIENLKRYNNYEE